MLLWKWSRREAADDRVCGNSRHRCWGVAMHLLIPCGDRQRAVARLPGRCHHYVGYRGRCRDRLLAWDLRRREYLHGLGLLWRVVAGLCDALLPAGRGRTDWRGITRWFL